MAYLRKGVGGVGEWLDGGGGIRNLASEERSPSCDFLFLFDMTYVVLILTGLTLSKPLL
jgi:hypothetical protein